MRSVLSLLPSSFANLILTSYCNRYWFWLYCLFHETIIWVVKFRYMLLFFFCYLPNDSKFRLSLPLGPNYLTIINCLAFRCSECFEVNLPNIWHTFHMFLMLFSLVVIDSEVFSLSLKVSILLQKTLIYVCQSEINSREANTFFQKSSFLKILLYLYRSRIFLLVSTTEKS